MSDRTPPHVRAARAPAPRHARPRTTRSRGVLLVLCALLSVGGGTLAADDRRGPDAARPLAAVSRGAPAPAAPTPSPTPTCTPAPLEARAAATLVVGLPGVVRADEPLAQDVVRLGVGGVFLSESNVRSGAQVAELSAGLRAAAGRPLLVATDEESGRVALMRDVVGAGPSPRRLAQRESPEQVRARAAATGRALAAVGVDLDLAPVLDLDDGPSGGVIGDRSFSADPAVASRYGLAYAAGLADAGVTPTVKHFPGHGRSRVDSHRASDVVTAGLDELTASDLVPFRDAVAAGVPVVMLNHLQYAALDPDLPASLSPRAYALLRGTGFTGVAITDSVGMGAVNLRWDFPEAAVQAVTAGADAVLATDGTQAVRMRDALVDAVRSGRLPEARLSEAAARVTALAGGDPAAVSCVDVELPRQAPAPAPAPTP
ncbi:glycoside hydrolase family 3 N-terminal domain-containing protein [Cellulomonas sp. KH9]|uniref:glycoside hydrolase family 3 N-terminal domain-containing protein n=1 Tax=Cellulomonas sp. KH9 TaxID=1855324 RepID=UPI0008E70B5B|nr:glycoside hydrolase family 3 N-terminal domain-containing protein [Cellulomonas sp. KH9]SFJ74882.1 beta-N-acetylhexosaminidase [Cellulomonas sp. KH9]